MFQKSIRRDRSCSCTSCPYLIGFVNQFLRDTEIVVGLFRSRNGLHLTPANITPKETEDEILTHIRNHPEYGPREISYLLENHGIKISESSVYNIMRRNGLSTREKRIRSARKKTAQPLFTLPPHEQMKSGECMHFFQFGSESALFRDRTGFRGISQCGRKRG